MISRILGILLRGRHADEQYLLWNELPSLPHEAEIQMTSPAFRDGMLIPERFAGKGVGDNVSPALGWSGVPAHAVELVLVMEDPDAPLSRPFAHLIASIRLPFDGGFEEGALSARSEGSRIVYGVSTFRKPGYSGPRALPGHGAHRYLFQIYALSKPSGLQNGARRRELVAALQGKIVGRGKLCGYFQRD